MSSYISCRSSLAKLGSRSRWPDRERVHVAFGGADVHLQGLCIAGHLSRFRPWNLALFIEGMEEVAVVGVPAPSLGEVRARWDGLGGVVVEGRAASIRG